MLPGVTWAEVRPTIVKHSLQPDEPPVDNPDHWHERGIAWKASVDGKEGWYRSNMFPRWPLNLSLTTGGENALGQRRGEARIMRTRHVSPEGSDEVEGSEAAPWKTLDKAFRELKAGEELLVHGGEYQPAILSRKEGASFRAPLIIRTANLMAKFSAEPPPTIRATSRAGIGGQCDFASIEGFTFRISGEKTGGVNLSGDHNTVRGCRFIGDGAGDAVSFRGQSNRIIANTFMGKLTRAIAYGYMGSVIYGEIRDNTFVDLMTTGTSANRTAGVGFIIRGNRFERVTGQFIFSTYHTACVRFENNLIADCLLAGGFGGAKSAMIRCERRMNHIYANNSFVFDPESQRDAMYLNGHGYECYNNIFVGFRRALVEGTLGAAVHWKAGPDYDVWNEYEHNYFFANKMCLDDTFGDRRGLGGLFRNHPSNIAGTETPFANAAGGDYRLKPRSVCVAAGDPKTNVLDLSGREADRIDIGWTDPGGDSSQMHYRVRAGNVVSDRAPTFTWTFNDRDNYFGGGQKQSRLQCQVDRVITFDSPDLIDSGGVGAGRGDGALNEWSIPEALALAPGRYYFRVRTADDFDPEVLGCWSDVLPFRVDPRARPAVAREVPRLMRLPGRRDLIRLAAKVVVESAPAVDQVKREANRTHIEFEDFPLRDQAAVITHEFASGGKAVSLGEFDAVVAGTVDLAKGTYTIFVRGSGIRPDADAILVAIDGKETRVAFNSTRWLEVDLETAFAERGPKLIVVKPSELSSIADSITFVRRGEQVEEGLVGHVRRRPHLPVEVPARPIAKLRREHGRVIVEAEDFPGQAYVAVLPDERASAGKCLELSEGLSIVRGQVDLRKGAYRVLIRGSGAGNSSDACHVKIDDLPQIRVLFSGTQWVERELEMNLEKDGLHTISFLCDEAATIVDRITFVREAEN